MDPVCFLLHLATLKSTSSVSLCPDNNATLSSADSICVWSTCLCCSLMLVMVLAPSDPPLLRPLAQVYTADSGSPRHQGNDWISASDDWSCSWSDRASTSHLAEYHSPCPYSNAVIHTDFNSDYSYCSSIVSSWRCLQYLPFCSWSCWGTADSSRISSFDSLRRLVLVNWIFVLNFHFVHCSSNCLIRVFHFCFRLFALLLSRICFVRCSWALSFVGLSWCLLFLNLFECAWAKMSDFGQRKWMGSAAVGSVSFHCFGCCVCCESFESLILICWRDIFLGGHPETDWMAQRPTRGPLLQFEEAIPACWGFRHSIYSNYHKDLCCFRLIVDCSWPCSWNAFLHLFWLVLNSIFCFD